MSWRLPSRSVLRAFGPALRRLLPALALLAALVAAPSMSAAHEPGGCVTGAASSAERHGPHRPDGGMSNCCVLHCTPVAIFAPEPLAETAGLGRRIAPAPADPSNGVVLPILVPPPRG